MENIKNDWRKKVPITKINKDLDKYRNSEWVLKKVAEAKRIIAESGLPDIYNKNQAEIVGKHRYTDTLVEQELSVAHEPTPVYGKPKEEEK